MSGDLESRVSALEVKVEEMLRAHNRHRHKFSVDSETGYPTYPVKKRWKSES